MFSKEARFRGETIPRANDEAIVATVDAVADGRSEFNRDGAFEFDGQVGNAPARIELKRRGDGGGGTGGDATRACATAIAFGRVGLEGRGGNDFGEEKP